MTEGMIQAFVNGGFVILGVFVGALITGLGNILARRRKDKEEQNKAVSCLLSLYFYVFQLYEDPLLESIDSHVKDINKLSDFENEIESLKNIVLPSRSKAMQKYWTDCVGDLDQRIRAIIDNLAAKDPILACSLEAKLHILKMMDLAENRIAEGLEKFAQVRNVELPSDCVKRFQQKTKKDVLQVVLESARENLFKIAGNRKGRKQIERYLKEMHSNNNISEMQMSLIQDFVDITIKPTKHASFEHN